MSSTQGAFDRTMKRMDLIGVTDGRGVEPQHVADGRFAFAGMDVDQREVSEAIKGLVVSYLLAIEKLSPAEVPGALNGMATQALLFGWELAQEDSL